MTLELSKVANMYAWGNNKCGQLGTQDNDAFVNRPVPIILSDPNTGHDKFNPIKVEKIACGTNHTLFLTRSGLVYMLGRYMHNSFLGEKVRYGNSTAPKLVECLPLEHAIIDISAGTEHNLALTEDQKVYTWGSGLMGELGLGINKKDVGNFKDAREIPIADKIT